MVIRRPKRFFLIMVLIILLFSQFGIFATNIIHAAQNYEERQNKKFLSQYEWVEWEITRGDTYWNIQKLLAPNSNICKLKNFVEKKNERQVGMIYPGETILLLKEKK